MTHLFLAIAFVATISSHAGTWEETPPFHRDIIDWVLPPTSDKPWTDQETREFVRQRGTRSASFLTTGLLMRNTASDVQNTASVVRVLLTLQHNAPGEPNHGLWMTSIDPDRDRVDQNWREFVGTGLLVARDRFPDLLGHEIVDQIDTALLLAAEGAKARDVDAHYTNIALMSAFLMDYVGSTQNVENLMAAGHAKATAIHGLFSKNKTFTEFNSPTYYGVNLMALEVWRALAKHEDLREWGADMEASLWADVGAFYHAGLRNVCGPFVRANEMDMAQGTAIVGLCIGMALNDLEATPLPAERKDWLSYEIAYAPILSLLGVNAPSDVVPHLRQFQGDRTLQRKVPYGPYTFDVTAILKDGWMMGSGTGMRRRWDQHHPGTLHWRTPGGEVGWLLVIGENAADCVIKNQAMQVFLSDPDPEHPLRVYVYYPDMSAETLQGSSWQLPGMSVTATSSLQPPTVTDKDTRRHGQVLEVSWPVSADWDPQAPALFIRVED